ncbi:serine/threonine protein kinase [Cupriavidus sp. USMAA2-4]|uniref:Serine/threonine protein kinase n=1 Tax=Cupriavidus malaysiensis TaxID=367825 RepID=A0A1D9I0D4_9BURK|nr:MULTISPECIES: serine/threonine-protein kinase [Cupriavidus]AOY91306.1 serine/threonine protein kinase [Cupriavidus sp. USMAA2-4]AOY99125.1 serine/threonine protein kinase [Cupriavidus sp. USMAHM13]AOZ05546.1 serine/threonine protein kinase [Cupriavidus malaysiensis]
MTESKGTSQPKSAPLPIGTLLSNYRIVKKLASGGFSFVYLATDETGTPVAIKEYLPGALARRSPGELIPVVPDENAASFRLGLKYFFEEGRSLARISHPSVVRVVNFFRENGTVYMVMNYEMGKTLQEHILQARQQGRPKVLREHFIRRVFHALMSGLREVHIHKLLHLDIKPGNIYLREDESPILLDFGAARQTLTMEAARFQPMYTPGFAAPELYGKHSELGPWSDIYSLGATLYACMAGMPPQEANQREKDDRMGDAMTRLRASYTGGLVDLVEWCLRLAPAERPQSVFRLQKELREQTNALSEQAPAPAPAAPEPAPTTRLMTLLRRREDQAGPATEPKRLGGGRD